MASLAPALRKKLEDAVKEARDVAEAGARAALEQLAVHATEPFAHLSPEDRELRNRLRARARQLGDGRDTRTGAHQIDHLVVECAYEHWHRMLFARFLAENGVLMANSEALGIENTPVTLDECEELAADEGAANGWELAGRYASKMLPQIFRPDAPVLAVHLPPERQRRLEQILAELSPETFKASDALGWVYQFWQAKKKDEVNASGVKIGADELPSVTQLFTEPYMVEFLLHNTLGAWWAGKVLAERPELARRAMSEDDLRQACALPGYRWTHLRFVREDNQWQPAAGIFDEWPRAASELRVLDPCCGSGHFLVAAFDILVRLRMVEEGFDSAEASSAVLQDNLYGLEIDERCTQLAAFALALAAWQVSERPGYRELPEVQIACSGRSPRGQRSQWMELAGDDIHLRNGMDRLFSMFQDAPILGSLIDPSQAGVARGQQSLGVAGFEQLRPLLLAQLANDASDDIERRELGVVAQGIAAAAEMLSEQFHLVVTNVPYLARGRQEPRLKAFCEIHYDEAKGDLATVCLERLTRLTLAGGTVGAVVPLNWTFLATYRELRRRLLRTREWSMLAKLGPGAFETISGEVVNVGLVSITNRAPRARHRLLGLDITEIPTATGKANALQNDAIRMLVQEDQLRNPDARLVLEPLSKGILLEALADSHQGLKSGDDGRFRRYFWEVEDFDRWRRLQSTVSATVATGGLESVIDWQNDGNDMARRQGLAAWGKSGVAVSQMSSLACALYYGDAFDSNVCPVVPKDMADLPALWAYCESGEFQEEVRRIDQKMAVANATMVKIPFERDRWRAVAAQRYPNGLPHRHSDDPTQAPFHGALRGASSPLQVGVATLLGFRWPEQSSSNESLVVDDDGIVCLPSVRGEEAAASRLGAVLADGFGEEWSTRTRDTLTGEVGAKGKGLDWWLQNKFFEQHCQLFQHRPFIWHIWDGIKKDGFGALINYHKLDRKLLETLTYTYLGDWIRRQQDDAARNVDGASERLDAARRLQQSLELILEGEKPHDIFVRWKPLQEQPIGWEPDLNDGVRVNIRPFMSVPDVDKKGAGVLRYKPNIHWKKDRGTDPDDAPWFDLGPSYGEPKGARINDHHLSLAEKRAARERAGGR